MRKIFTVLVLMTLIMCLASDMFSAPRTILLRVETEDLAWAETHLSEKLLRILSRDSELRIVSSIGSDDSMPGFPSASHDIDSLLDWGREVGGRYLMLVTIHSQRLEKRKTFSIPLILHKYKTIGVIEGELRFLDLQRGRLLAAEPFKEELAGRRIIQGDPDNSKDDPDLHIPRPEKTAFFSRLEDKLAKRLTKRLKVLVRGR